MMIETIIILAVLIITVTILMLSALKDFKLGCCSDCEELKSRTDEFMVSLLFLTIRMCDSMKSWIFLSWC